MVEVEKECQVFYTAETIQIHEENNFAQKYAPDHENWDIVWQRYCFQGHFLVFHDKWDIVWQRYCFQGHFFLFFCCVCYLLWNFLFLRLMLVAAGCCCVCNVSLLWDGDASGFISMGCISLKSVKCPAHNNRVTFNVLS